MKAEHGRQLAVFGAVAVLFCAGGVVSIVFGIRMYRENRIWVKGRRGVKLLPESTQTRAEADRVSGELRAVLGLQVEVTSDE